MKRVVLIGVGMVALCQGWVDYRLLVNARESLVRHEHLAERVERLGQAFEARARVDALVEKYKGASYIELTTSRVQDIGHGFYLVGVETSVVPGGLRITGKVINATSIRHDGITFKVAIEKSSDESSAATIACSTVPAGGSAPFSITVPGVTLGGYGGAGALVSYEQSWLRY